MAMMLQLAVEVKAGSEMGEAEQRACLGTTSLHIPMHVLHQIHETPSSPLPSLHSIWGCGEQRWFWQRRSRSTYA